MKVKYLGSRSEIPVLVRGKVVKHKKDKVMDYPKDVAEELLKSADNDFEEVKEKEEKPAPTKDKKDERQKGASAKPTVKPGSKK